MTRIALTSLCLCLVTCSGCHPQVIDSQTNFRPQDSASSQSGVVANPQYNNWSKFPIGTYVITRTQTPNRPDLLIRTELVEKNSDSVELSVIERLVFAGEHQTGLPVTRTVYSKMYESKKQTIEPKQEEPITEGVIFADQRLEVYVTDFVNKSQSSESTIRLWHHDDIPGGTFQKTTYNNNEIVEDCWIETIYFPQGIAFGSTILDAAGALVDLSKGFADAVGTQGRSQRHEAWE